MLFSTCCRSIGILVATLSLGCSTRVRDFSSGAGGSGGDDVDVIGHRRELDELVERRR
ncbi:hypothetical protein ACMHYB_16510 [Sorangium sp. So ce1128]